MLYVKYQRHSHVYQQKRDQQRAEGDGGPRRDGGVGVQIKEQIGHFILGQFWPK